VEIVFVVDPMCSWCWGFAPVIEKLREKYGERHELSLVMGGLRTRGHMEWDEGSKSYLKDNWAQVTSKTGQSFSHALFEREKFEYDTYPACKAVVSLRELMGMRKAFDYLHILHKAFYLEFKDTTSLKVLINLLQGLYVDIKKFEEFYNSSRAEILMQHDFAKARSMGANSFPSVVIIDDEGHMVCQKGYRSYEEMKRLISIKENNA